MSDNYFIRVQKATQTRFWINNVTREGGSVTVRLLWRVFGSLIM